MCQITLKVWICVLSVVTVNAASNKRLKRDEGFGDFATLSTSLTSSIWPTFSHYGKQKPLIIYRKPSYEISKVVYSHSPYTERRSDSEELNNHVEALQSINEPEEGSQSNYTQEESSLSSNIQKEELLPNINQKKSHPSNENAKYSVHPNNVNPLVKKLLFPLVPKNKVDPPSENSPSTGSPSTKGLVYPKTAIPLPNLEVGPIHGFEQLEHVYDLTTWNQAVNALKQNYILNQYRIMNEHQVW